MKIPDAKNATLQAWDTNRRDLFVGQAGITLYTTRASVPAVLRPFLVQVERSDSPNSWVNRRYVRYADLQSAPYVRNAGTDQEQSVPGDYFRVRNNGVITAKLKSQVVAGDKPVDWTEVHSWYGVADELGEN